MNYTFIALVENKPGVLNRVASLFRRRNFQYRVAGCRADGESRSLTHDHCGGLSQR